MTTVAMSHAGYVAAGWTLPLLAIALHALRTLRRGRALAQRVAPEERRWS